jgi:hypothetical protein
MVYIHYEIPYRICSTEHSTDQFRKAEQAGRQVFEYREG